MIVGSENIVVHTNSTIPSVLVHASSNDYLMFYGCGGGSSMKMAGTGFSQDFVTYKPKVIINILLCFINLIN